MLIEIQVLKERLHGVLINKSAQGYLTDGLSTKLDSLPNSYDALLDFAEGLNHLSFTPNWPYFEPNGLEEIWSEANPDRPMGPIGIIKPDESAKRVESAFLASVCGCILGKPLEVGFTGKEIRKALTGIGEWPMREYVSKKVKDVLPRINRTWPETVRELISFVAPDDDINYTIMGMLILEQYGLEFTHEDISNLWVTHLPIGTTFGPERAMLIQSGVRSDHFRMKRNYYSDEGGFGPVSYISTDDTSSLLKAFNDVLNPGDELCGATIRADAYGYACPGRPDKAAELAWKDASFTHNRTGIYGTMFVAAAIAVAQSMDDRLGIIETALMFVPQRSRFYERATSCLMEIDRSHNWEDGYERINNKYGKYGHCRIYQEIGMLINTLKFAEDIGHGICIQVSQGADTDSFGATAGSLLGAYFGPGYLEPRWLEPFNDDIHTGMAWFFERSLSKLAKRMGNLPAQFATELSND